jgi:DUF1016 N-terminal domain
VGTALHVSRRDIVLTRRLIEIYPTEGDIAAVMAQVNRHGQPLTWSHFRILLSEDFDTNRRFLMSRALQESWTARQLNRHITWAYGRRRPACGGGRPMIRPESMEAAVVRWAKTNADWIRSNYEIFDPDLMMALFEADPSPAILDHALSEIADQLAAILLQISHQLWLVSDLREEARARISTSGHAEKQLKFKLVQIDDDEVGPGDS